MAPPPSARKLARAMMTPWRAISSTLFAMLYGITSRTDDRYPCAPPNVATRRELDRELGTAVSLRANDGVVPTASQVWGKIVWAGAADHLDVLGHFPSPPPPVSRPFWSRWMSRPPPVADLHVDWLSSGAGFDDAAFAGLMDAIAEGMLAAAQRGASVAYTAS
jgi:hypothetical protein